MAHMHQLSSRGPGSARPVHAGAGPRLQPAQEQGRVCGLLGWRLLQALLQLPLRDPRPTHSARLRCAAAAPPLCRRQQRARPSTLSSECCGPPGCSSGAPGCGSVSELNCRLSRPWLAGAGAGAGAGTARDSSTRSAQNPVFRTLGVNPLSLLGREGRRKRPEPDSEATESPNESRVDEIRAGRWMGTGSLRWLSGKLLAASSLSERLSARLKGTTLRLADPTRLGGVALRAGGALLLSIGCAIAASAGQRPRTLAVCCMCQLLLGPIAVFSVSTKRQGGPDSEIWAKRVAKWSLKLTPTGHLAPRKLAAGPAPHDAWQSLGRALMPG